MDYVEQPLKEGEEFNLEELYENRPVPIYLDEICRFSENISSFAHCVDGVNMKLMKCGGITEALKIIKTARKYKLKTMIGCMSESSVSIAAAAALSGGIDHIDLDSHYNLAPDPSTGAPMVDGVTLPPDIPGHGGELKKSFMLDPNSKVAVYMEGHIDSDYGKMGMGVVRYLKINSGCY